MYLDRVSGAHPDDEREGAHHDDRADDHEAHERVFGFHGTEHAVRGQPESLKVLTLIAIAASLDALAPCL